eukprot:Em0008g140a
MVEVRIVEVRMVEVRMVAARIVEARIVEARIVEARIVEARIVEARIVEARIVEARIVEARIVEARIVEARIVEARIVEARIVEARIVEARIVEARIVEAQIVEAQIVEARVEKVQIVDAQIVEARALKARIVEAQMVEVQALKAEEVQVEAEEVQVEAEEVQVEAEEVQVEAEEVQVEAEEVQVEAEEVQVEAEEVQVEAEEVQVEVEEVQVEVEEVQVEAKEVQVEVEEVQVQLVEVHLLVKRIKSLNRWTLLMTVKRQNKTWMVSLKRRLLLISASNGFSQPTQLRMYNYADATVFEYFLACFPSNLVDEICILMMQKGREQRKGCPFTVTKGDFWLFMGYLLYILCHPMDLPIQDYWEGPLSTKYENCSACVKHDIGKFGLSYGRFRRLMQAFTLPQYPAIEGKNDPFCFIRRFVDEWNVAMQHCISPGKFLVVDESMGQWLGKGMPGLMYVARKPTPNGREGHTTADAETGCIIFYEVYEGKILMAEKEHVNELGAGTAIALRLTAPWVHSGRIVILDSGFASLKTAIALAEVGLYMIGNVKTAHSGFPKKWLNSQVSQRGDRACATHSFTMHGRQMDVLAAIDKDKQPMSLIGTAGTTSMGTTLERHFTVRHSSGKWQTRTATLEQWHIHELYRANFNAIDKHNSKRQGATSFEDTWKTHSWWVRDYQILFGMSEVNAFLLWNKFKPSHAMSMTQFRLQLCHQMLTNQWIQEEREAACRKVIPCDEEEDTDTVHELVHCDRGHCRMCGVVTRWRCACTPQSGTASGRKRNDASAMFLCPASKRRCLILHIKGVKPQNLKQQSRPEMVE